nr:MAG TPA: competence protein [Caudoviricetes sp.]
MLTAEINGKPINCYDGSYDKDLLKKWASKNIIKCPVCHNAYEYCHGRLVPPYFRHKDKIDCEVKYSEPETEEHIQGKIALFNWIKSQDGVTDAVMEGWLPTTKQRPDVMFWYNNQ